MQKIEYRLTCQSSVIVSPRANFAFYGALEDFMLHEIQEDEFLEKEKLKVIYPFYRYGTYKDYDPKDANYYLPGSSIKGALCQGTPVANDFRIDDITIQNKDIVLRNLYKMQYLEEEQKACFQVFFENVGVEMLKAKAELKGELYLASKDAAERLVCAANDLTKIKIKQMREYICRLQKKGYNNGLYDMLKKLEGDLTFLLKPNNLFLLGGYKGLLHSMQLNSPIENLSGAVFLDKECMLPHGLVKIELL